MLHYNPQHVSSSSLVIFRRTNCIITASGIVTLGRTVRRLRATSPRLTFKNFKLSDFFQNSVTLTRHRRSPWWWSIKIETCRSFLKCFKVNIL